MPQAAVMKSPAFDQILVKQFDKTINLIIKQNVFNYESSDICYGKDDVYQECLMHLWNATKIYDPTKGMKFKTFAIFHIKSRIGNFRNKVVRKNENGTISMSQLNSGWGITGTEESSDKQESKAPISSQYKGLVSDLNDGQNALNEILDAKMVLSKLTGNRKIIFTEYYIKGKKINEICEDNEDLKYHKIRREMKYLDQIHRTLIKGETPCLR